MTLPWHWCRRLDSASFCPHFRIEVLGRDQSRHDSGAVCGPRSRQGSEQTEGSDVTVNRQTACCCVLDSSSGAGVIGLGTSYPGLLVVAWLFIVVLFLLSRAALVRPPSKELPCLPLPGLLDLHANGRYLISVFGRSRKIVDKRHVNPKMRGASIRACRKTWGKRTFFCTQDA